MNIVVIGSGGREHAIVKKISESSQTTKIYAVPGNGGTAKVSKTQNVDLPLSPPFIEVVAFCKEQHIDLVVVGPENPLVEGISDILQKERITVFGPNKKASRLEGSKMYAKQMMQKAGIPTASYQIFRKNQIEDAKKYIITNEKARVLKADGLCGGKGVIVCKTEEQALSSLAVYFEQNRFGEAGSILLIEDLIEGEEVSVIAFTDGISIKVLPPSQDHKRLYEHDTGPNTGGMGVYAPVTFLKPEHIDFIENNILKAIIDTLSAEGIVYCGILYAGLMIHKNTINVLEFNVRFGDPECQCILPLVENDLLEIIDACVHRTLQKINLQIKIKSACNVVMVAGGYPDAYENGKVIYGLDTIAQQQGEIEIFEAGTMQKEEKCITNGGRVLSLTATGDTLQQAKQLVYENIEKISFAGAYYRKDIANKAI